MASLSIIEMHILRWGKFFRVEMGGGQAHTEAQLWLSVKAIAEISSPVFSEAAELWNERGKFFPKPAEILELCKEIEARPVCNQVQAIEAGPEGTRLYRLHNAINSAMMRRSLSFTPEKYRQYKSIFDEYFQAGWTKKYCIASQVLGDEFEQIVKNHKCEKEVWG